MVSGGELNVHIKSSAAFIQPGGQSIFIIYYFIIEHLLQSKWSLGAIQNLRA